MISFSRRWLFASLHLISVTAINDHKDAIIPTTSGEIGVNPITDFPAPSNFVGKIGVNTEYLTDVGGGTLAWIGVDDSFITLVSVTVTTVQTNEPPKAVYTDVSIAVETAAAGDLSVLTAPNLRQGLTDIVGVTPPCVASKFRHRQAGVCGFNAFIESVAADDAVLAQVNQIGNALSPGRLLIPASDIAELVASFKAATGSAPVVGAAGLSLLYLMYIEATSNAEELPPVLNIPASLIGTTTSTTAANATSTTSAVCQLPTGADMPWCPDTGCQGEKTYTCTIGEFENCECLGNSTIIGSPVDTAWLNASFQISQISLTPAPMPAASCDPNDKVTVDTKVFSNLSSLFCINNTLAQSSIMTYTAQDADISGYEGYSFMFSWSEGTGYCLDECQAVYASFLGNTNCSSNSNTMSNSGILDLDCGRATFNISDDAPPSAPTSFSTGALPTSSTVARPSSRAGPAQGVPTCTSHTAGRFQRDDAASSAKTFCKQFLKQSASGQPYSWSFPNVDTYQPTSLASWGGQFNYMISPNQDYCPEGANVNTYFKLMTWETCQNTIMIGIDGCPPYSPAPADNGKFLKWGGVSYENCAVWQGGAGTQQN